MPGRTRSFAAIAIALMVPSVLHAAPLGPGFTYPGELQQAGVPFDGSVHLRLSLWDAAGTGAPPAGGTPIGASDVASSVPIADGRFSVEVNAGGEFGVQAFNGQARWLQIEVCADSTCGSTTVLAPRQPITAAPYALGPWRLEADDLSYANGRVGIGTSSPLDLLHVNGGMRWGGATSNYVYSAVDGSGRFVEHKGSAINNSRLRVQSSRNGDQINYTQLNVDPARGASILGLGTGSRRLGVGTQTPAASLDVRGTIKVGSSGEYFVPGADTDLRIVRGVISNTGLISFGTGFTVTRTGVGVYAITFTTPFVDQPSIVATCQASIDRIAVISSHLPGSCTIPVVSGSGTPVDNYFDFIAIGRR